MGAPTIYVNQNYKAQKAKRKWWDEEENVYNHVWDLYDRMKTHQAFRSTNNLRFARLYSNLDLLGLKAGQYARVTDPKAYQKSRVTYNVIKSCTDAATAKIAQNKPRPVYLTENGSFNEQLRAKRMNQFILGMFEQIGTGTGEDRTMYGLGRQCFRDGCVFGTGVINFFDQDNEVKAERNLCEEVIVDETEGMYRKPRQLHRSRFMSREVLLDLYPKQAQKILELPGVDESVSTFETTADMVEVLESWHLPSGPNANDGRHLISTRNCDLMPIEDYEDDFFPFLFMRWNHRLLGFYGMGLAEELLGIQLEINKLLRNIQIAQHLMATPQIWLEYQAKTVKKKINNAMGGIKYYTGRPPIFMTPQAMNAEIYQHLERLYQRAFELTGISLLTATSKKPAGLNSAVALREYKDTETERFAVQENMYEDWFVEAAEMIRKRCRKLVKAGKDPVVSYRDGTSMKIIRFSDVDVDDSKLVVAPRPSQLLPKEPAGKLAYVQELIEAGIYDKDEAVELLDFPDTQKMNNVKLSHRRVVIKIVETMVEENKYIVPEPYINLDFAREYAQAQYAAGKIDEMPEDRLELLRRFMSDVDELIVRRDAEMQRRMEEERARQEQESQVPSPESMQTPLPGALPAQQAMEGAAALPQEPIAM
jgi:hypothetical protein